MGRQPGDRPLVGLFEEGPGAEDAARKIRASGIQAGVVSGTEVVEGRIGRHLARGLVIGLLIALPFAIGVPLIGWARGGTLLTSLLFVPPILFVGAALGLLIPAARRDGTSMWKRARARLVVTERELDPPASDMATTIINESGGDMIETSGSNIPD